MTYIRTWEGWLYLAVVMDLYSRRIVGWPTKPTLRSHIPRVFLILIFSCLCRATPRVEIQQNHGTVGTAE